MPTPTVRITETLDSRMSHTPPFAATRVFEVSYENYDTPPKEWEVLTAKDTSGAADAVDVPQAYDVHPRNVQFVCKGPNLVRRKGPFYFVVQCDYDFNGSPVLAGQVNPLSLPPQYTWSTITVETEVDTDAGGRLICDSAGNVIRQTRPYVIKGLRVAKWFSAFDLTWFTTMENTVNSTGVNVNGIPIPSEHMLCTSINPSPFYKNAWRAIEVEFLFQIVLSDKLLNVSRFPFALRLLDAGRAGWYSNSGTKKLDFSDGKGNVVSDDILLGGDGRPLNPPFGYVKVGSENKDPVTPPTAFPAYNQDVGTVYPNAVFRYFEKYPKANHGALPIW